MDFWPSQQSKTRLRGVRFYRLLRAMASLIDSRAQFAQRCKDVGLSTHIENRLKASGITSLGVLAYSHGQPGQALNEDSFRAWLRTDVDPSIGLADAALVKRLLLRPILWSSQLSKSR